MSDIVKAAFVLAAAALVCTAMAIFFSPFHTCMRGKGEDFTVKYCLD